MSNRLNTSNNDKMRINKKNGFLFTGLCIMLLIAFNTLIAAGQVTYTTPTTSQYIPVQASQTQYNPSQYNPVQESNYCVAMGYLYTTDPTINGGRGACVFSDNTWCDAHAFYIGNCSPNPYVTYNPYVISSPYVVSNPSVISNPYPTNTTLTGLNLADATSYCRINGGTVQTVHTAYGDVDLCVFPDGSSVDLRDLYNNIAGGSGITGNPGSISYLGPYSDNWYYTAYNFLNSP